MDEQRVQFSERRFAEPEALETARPKVLDEDVRTGQEPPQDRCTLCLAKVEPDAPLRSVHSQVIRSGPGAFRLVADPRRPPAARRVALGRLDLHDVGAEIGEEHRAVGPGEDGGTVDDTQAGERPNGRRGHPAMVTTPRDRRTVAPVTPPRPLLSHRLGGPSHRLGCSETQP